MTSTQDLSVTVRATGIRGPAQGCWTYEDYATLPNDGKRFEVIAGVLFMSPGPNRSHQNAVLAIATHLRLFIHAPGLGEVYIAPFDVRLKPSGTVVQPDVLVVLSERSEILSEAGVSGAPNLVVEVVSPSTATYDRREKMDAYSDAGVPEYWIADPYAVTIELFVLAEGVYVSRGAFQHEGVLPSAVLPEFSLTVAELFR